MSKARIQFEKFCDEVSDIADKIGAPKANLKKSEKYSTQVLESIEEKMPVIQGVASQFVTASEALPALATSDRKRVLDALNGMLNNFIQYRDFLVGISNASVDEETKVKYKDAEKLLKKLQEIEKKCDEFVKKNSKDFSTSDHFTLGLLQSYFDLVKNLLHKAINSKAVMKEQDSGVLKISSTNECSAQVVRLCHYIALVEELNRKLNEKYGQTSDVVIPSTHFHHAGSATVDKKHDKSGRPKAKA